MCDDKRNRCDTASYLMFTSFSHTASNSERKARASTSSTVQPKAESPPTAFAWITRTAAALTALGLAVQ